MKKQSIGFMLLIGLSSSVVFAGATSNMPVEIDYVTNTAHGNMVDARFSENKYERIGCGQSGSEFSEQGWCQAALTSGKNIICFTENPILLRKISAMDDYSYIKFTWNDSGDCTFIYTSTQSQYIP